MQRLFEHLAAEEIAEDADASEEDGAAEVEKLKQRGVGHAIVANAVAAAYLRPKHKEPMDERERDGRSSQQVDPPAAARKEGLLPFKPEDAADLAQGLSVHTVAPSAPIRY